MSTFNNCYISAARKQSSTKFYLQNIIDRGSMTNAFQADHFSSFVAIVTKYQNLINCVAHSFLSDFFKTRIL